MSTLPAAPEVIEHTIVVTAAPETLFDLIAEVERWPQFHEPSVYADRPVRSHNADVVRHWLLSGEQVDLLLSHRILDRPRLRIEQHRLDPRPPLVDSTVIWTVEPLSETESRIRLRHEFGSSAADFTAQFAERIQRSGPRQLAAIADAARPEARGELLLSFTDPLFIGGSVDDAYAFLYEADKWPERVEHVNGLEMTEDIPGVQFFDMDTHTPDGAAHTTRSVRLCFPRQLIVYKQIQLPKLLDAHTGHWLFTTAPEGVVAEARHTVVIKPAALSLLGPDATVADARRYLRRVLSGNSLNTLRHAKEFTELRTGLARRQP
ncbi:SRPBCC family protein [Nocardia sp. NPDC020380]|uniref:SRPBCC family protein n=1 Tax=Nocardia sp. NPDC020380 TaxID=3364309 RepID=UPI0037A71AA1